MSDNRGLLFTLGQNLDFRPCIHPYGNGVASGRGGETLPESIRERLLGAALTIRDKNGRLVLLQPNRAQREFARTCTERNIVLKARQLGLTTYVAARFFLHTITRPGTLTVQVAHDRSSAEGIFRIIHRFLAHLPDHLREDALMTSHKNVRQIVFRRLDSEYRVESAADRDAGRGFTIQNLHCSEVARWPRDAAETLASLRTAVPAGGEIVLESTPNGAGGCFYEEWQCAEQNGYTRHFYPWWWDAEYVDELLPVEELSEEEQELVSRFGLRKTQIAFRRRQFATLRKLAPQEFAEDPVQCFLASGDCVFDVPVIQSRLAHCGEPMESRDSGRLLIWFPPQPRHDYIIAVDPAGGGSQGDYACAQVIERETGMQCAELYGHFGPRELAAKVAQLGREYNRGLVAVERNNHGFGVLAHLVTGERYSRIFESGGQPGWLTTAANRPAMIENLAAILATAPALFHSDRFLKECRTFIRHENGWSGAASGAHDDSVIAMGIAFMVRKQVVGASPRGPSIVLGTL